MVLDDEPFDAGPLTWIKPEIDLALGRSLAAIQAYQESVKKGSPDLTQFRFCRTHLHQVHGALSMADIEGLPMITEAEEDLLIALEDKKVVANEDVLQVIFSANYAIEQYLNSLLANEQPQPLRLAPILNSIEQATGKSPSGKSALFFPRNEIKTQFQQPNKISEADKQTKLKSIRSQFQLGLLKWMQFAEKEGTAAQEKSTDGISKLRLSFNSLIEISESPTLQDYWQIAAAFCAVLSNKQYIARNNAHRLCTLFDAQLRKMMQNSSRINERHRRELLYYLASIPDGIDQLSDHIRHVYRLGDYNLTSVKTNFVQLTPEIQQHLGDLNNCLRSAETTLGQYVGGSIPALGALIGFTKKIETICKQLNLPALQTITLTLSNEINRLNGQNQLIPLHQSYELICALRLITFAQIKYTEFVGELNKKYSDSVDVLVQRIAHYAKDNSVVLSPPDSNLSLLADLFNQGKSRIQAISLARKIQGILANIEQLLDTYFRDTNNQENLPVAEEFLDKIIKELTQIGKPQAANYLTVIREKINELPITKQSDKDFAVIAKNLSRFGFYVDALLAGNTDVDFDLFSLGLNKKATKPLTSLENKNVQLVPEQQIPNSTVLPVSTKTQTSNNEVKASNISSSVVTGSIVTDQAKSNQNVNTTVQNDRTPTILSTVISTTTTNTNKSAQTPVSIEDLILPNSDFTSPNKQLTTNNLTLDLPDINFNQENLKSTTTNSKQISSTLAINTTKVEEIPTAVTAKEKNYFDQALQSLVANFELDDVAPAERKEIVPSADLSNSLGIDLDLVLLMDGNNENNSSIQKPRKKDDDSLGIDLDLDFFTKPTTTTLPATVNKAQTPTLQTSTAKDTSPTLLSARVEQNAQLEKNKPAEQILPSVTQNLNSTNVSQAPEKNLTQLTPTSISSDKVEITTTPVQNITGSLFKKRGTTNKTPPSQVANSSSPDTNLTAHATTIQAIPTTTSPPVIRVEEISENKELAEIFLEEANEIIARLDKHYQTILAEPTHPTVLQDFRRGLHTLKGSGRTVGLIDFSTMAGSFEATLNEWLRTNEFKINFLHVSFLNNICSLLHQWLDYQKHDSIIPPDINIAAKQHPFFKIIPAIAPTTTTTLSPPGSVKLVATDLTEHEKKFVLEAGHGGAKVVETASSAIVEKVFNSPTTTAQNIKSRGIKTSIEIPSLISETTPPLLNPQDTKQISGKPSAVSANISTVDTPNKSTLVKEVTTTKPSSQRFISPGLFAIFREEASDLLGTLQSGLALMNEIPGQATPKGMIRAAHTLAGSSATVGLELAGQLTRALEYALERRNQGDFSHSSNQLLNVALDKITQLIDLVNEPNSPELVVNVNELVDKLNKSYLLVNDTESTNGKIITKDINVNSNIASQLNSDLAANLAADITDNIVSDQQKKANLSIKEKISQNAARLNSTQNTKNANQSFDDLIDNMSVLDIPRKGNNDVVLDVEIPLPASAEERNIKSTLVKNPSQISTAKSNNNTSNLKSTLEKRINDLEQNLTNSTKIQSTPSKAAKNIKANVVSKKQDDDLDSLAFPELLYDDVTTTLAAKIKEKSYFPENTISTTDPHSIAKPASKIVAVLTNDQINSPFTLDVVGLKSGEIDPQMFEVFKEEADELIENINQSLVLIRQGNYDAAADLQRILHTFKGAARMVGSLNLGERVHDLETKLGKFLLKPPLSNVQLSAIQAESDIIATALENMQRLYDNKKNNVPIKSSTTKAVVIKTTENPRLTLQEKAPPSTSVRTEITTAQPIKSTENIEPNKKQQISTRINKAEIHTDTTLATNKPIEKKAIPTTSSQTISTSSSDKLNQPHDKKSQHVEINQKRTSLNTTVENKQKSNNQESLQFSNSQLSPPKLVTTTTVAKYIPRSGMIYRKPRTKEEKIASPVELFDRTEVKDQLKPSAISNISNKNNEEITNTVSILKATEIHSEIVNNNRRNSFIPRNLSDQLSTISTQITQQSTTGKPSNNSTPKTNNKKRAVIHSKVENKSVENIKENLNNSENSQVKETISSSPESDDKQNAEQINETTLLTTTVNNSLVDFKTKLIDTLRELELSAKPSNLLALNNFENQISPVFRAPQKPEKNKTLIRVQLDKIDDLAFRSSEIAQAFGRTHDDVLQIKQALSELGGNVTRLRRHLDELSIQAASDNINVKTLNNEFDSLDVERFSRLRETAQLIAESIEDIANVESSLKHDISETNETLNHQKQLNRSLQDDIQALRVMPFSTITDRLQRLVRLTAKELNKDVRLVIINADEGLDRSILDRLTPALEHLLRNAIVHGIEDNEMRTSFGKNAQGKITIKLTRHANEIRIAVSDDGRGIDVVSIASKAESEGLLKAQHLKNRQALLDLIFVPGFSTASNISELSGRGVGMDVVKNDVMHLGGRISLETQTGAGTVFFLNIPVNQSLQQALIIKTAESIYALSSTLVEQVLERKNNDLEKLRQDGVIEWNNHNYSFFYLPHLLGQNLSTANIKSHSHIILLSHGEQKLAIEVDHIITHKEILVRPITQLISTKQLNNFNGIEGATILEQGQLALIINPLVLFQRAIALEHHEDIFLTEIKQIQELRVEKVAIMVVDDSLTVRKFSAKMLERAGYNVIVARDGDEAFHTIANLPDLQLPRVILCDVDMPKRDGFDFLRAVKTDQRLRWLPVIMITSRTAEKHQNLAFELGASHYMGKPFVESELLDLLEQYANYPLSLNGIALKANTIIEQNFFGEQESDENNIEDLESSNDKEDDIENLENHEKSEKEINDNDDLTNFTETEKEEINLPISTAPVIEENTLPNSTDELNIENTLAQTNSNHENLLSQLNEEITLTQIEQLNSNLQNSPDIENEISQLAENEISQQNNISPEIPHSEENNYPPSEINENEQTKIVSANENITAEANDFPELITSAENIPSQIETLTATMENTFLENENDDLPPILSEFPPILSELPPILPSNSSVEMRN